ncbi:MAG: hypothetical protein ABEN55_11225, partial [Bradymonadaceae bacterium]
GEGRRAVELAARAEESLRESGCFHDSLRAANVRIAALLELGRADEARDLVESRLDDFCDHADAIPSEFQSQFHTIPT